MYPGSVIVLGLGSWERNVQLELSEVMYSLYSLAGLWIINSQMVRLQAAAALNVHTSNIQPIL